MLGLDGMPWGYLNKLLEKGSMPYLRGLVNKSFNGVLKAYPPLTPPSWASIMSGVNPGKHGIFNFFKYERGTWKQTLTSADDLEHPRIHEMLAQLSVKSVVFNPIPDYPISPSNHYVVVSNLFHTPTPSSHPKEAIKELFGEENPMDYTWDMTCKSLRDYTKVLELYLDAVDKALKYEHQLLWVNLNIPDALFHRCPQILTSTSVTPDESRLFGMVDELVKLMRENHDSIIIVSDHGFSKYDTLISINDILVAHGLAETSSKQMVMDIADYRLKSEKEMKEAVMRVEVPVSLYSFIKKAGLAGLAKKVLGLITLVTGKRVRVRPKKWIDVLRSVAFMPDRNSFGIYLNDPGAREKVLGVLRKYSAWLKAMPSEEVYWGPYLRRAPDIVVFPDFDRGCMLNISGLLWSDIVRDTQYFHHPDGIVIINTDHPMSYPSNGMDVPNHAVASIAMCLLDKPLPKSRDAVPELERTFCDEIKEFDYLSRWRVQKRIRKLKLRRKAS